MIEVADLRKSYGRFDAVSGVSFTVGKGEILGFLGPNGAGKTTTMRILACYLPPTGASEDWCGGNGDAWWILQPHAAALCACRRDGSHAVCAG